MILDRQDLNWCIRRLPHALRDMMDRQGPAIFVAGGFVRSCICQDRVNDVDVFVGSKELATVLSKELGGTDKLIETGNAFTVKCKPFPVQFIHRWLYSTPEECVTSFDFTIAKAALWSDGKHWSSYCDDRFYQDLAAKRLVYTKPVRNENAGGSLLRVLKFYQRGYRIPLDSMGAVVARLLNGVHDDSSLFWKGENKNGKAASETEVEDYRAKILTGLLFEVDPNADLSQSSHLPPMEKADEETTTKEEQ